MTTDPEFITVDARGAVVRFQLGVYGLDPILRAVHRFSERCHVHAEQDGEGTVLVRVTPKRPLDNTKMLAGELANEVLDQTLRARLSAETEPIRRLLVAQAFSKANLIHPELDVAAPGEDPLRVSQPDGR